ncbi:hypothetical protein FA15DRAFT_656817 [Coprinopsis marcescibilis]|uniref:Uncharacterized protein n=1 Tax=Coprinopsis marcescibilis TaxID=230819 RepID=A0A5C3KS75_COPMA|nr:hypothetical protein FA15DRAFT_656817 [Coprinopsis marcescibilis]
MSKGSSLSAMLSHNSEARAHTEEGEYAIATLRKMEGEILACGRPGRYDIRGKSTGNEAHHVRDARYRGLYSVFATKESSSWGSTSILGVELPELKCTAVADDGRSKIPDKLLLARLGDKIGLTPTLHTVDHGVLLTVSHLPQAQPPEGAYVLCRLAGIYRTFATLLDLPYDATILAKTYTRLPAKIQRFILDEKMEMFDPIAIGLLRAHVAKRFDAPCPIPPFGSAPSLLRLLMEKTKRANSLERLENSGSNGVGAGGIQKACVCAGFSEWKIIIILVNHELLRGVPLEQRSSRRRARDSFLLADGHWTTGCAEAS